MHLLVKLYSIKGGIFMHWAYEYAEKLKIIRAKRNKDKSIIVAAGTSPSGTVHIGNFRDIVTAYFIVKALKNQGEDAKLLFSWDDYDRFRKVPKNISAEKQVFYQTQIGKPYSKIPSPFEEGETYATHYEKEYEDALREVGIIPDIIRYQTEEYESGRYAKQSIKALKARKEIFDILDKHRTQDSTEEERESYFPLSVYCNCCGKDNTKVLSFDGESTVQYHCEECNTNGIVDINTQNNYKLPWKVDWPMRWREENVQLEPGGTDHAAEHGSYTVSKQVSKDVYGYEPPEFVPYAFIGIKGLTVKMSSSSGINISLSELLKVYPPEMILWLYARRQLNDEFKIDLGKDVPRVYKEFDKFKRDFYKSPEDASEMDKQIMSLISDGRPYNPNLISFDKLVTVYGASNKNLKIMADMLRKLDLKVENSPELKERLSKVIHWAENYSPESIIKVNSEPNSEYFEQMSETQKEGISKFINGINDRMNEDEIMRVIYDIPKKSSGEAVSPELKARQKAVFKDLYNLIISSDRGPALSTLIKAVGTEKIKELITPLMERKIEFSNSSEVNEER